MAERLKWVLVALVAAIFIPWWALTAARDRSARLAIELHTPFVKPFLDVRFSKKIPYDPQSFIGRGREAGYWEWSPEGLTSTSKGRLYFEDAGDSISGAVAAGKREIRSIESVQDRNGGRQERFHYDRTNMS